MQFIIDCCLINILIERMRKRRSRKMTKLIDNCIIARFECVSFGRFTFYLLRTQSPYFQTFLHLASLRSVSSIFCVVNKPNKFVYRLANCTFFPSISLIDRVYSKFGDRPKRRQKNEMLIK